MNIRTLESGTLLRPIFDRLTVVVSDEHQNIAGAQDDFQAELFAAFIDLFPPGKVIIVRAGDNYDVSEGRNRAAIIRHNRQVNDRLGLHDEIRVPGNHDEDDAVPPEAYVYETPDVVIMHGHQFDPAFSGRWAWLGRAAARAWGWLEAHHLAWRWGKDTMLRWLDRRVATIRRRGTGNDPFIFEAYRRDKPVFATGHSHKPQLRDLSIPWYSHELGVWLTAPQGHYYLNPGSWTEKGRGYAGIIDGVNIRLVEVTP